MLLVAYIMSVYIMQCKIMFPLFYGLKPPSLFSVFKRLRSTGGLWGVGGGREEAIWLLYSMVYKTTLCFWVLNLFFINLV